MTNELNMIESAITNVEAELQKLDRLIANTKVNREIVAALEADVGALRINAGGLDARARGSKFAAASGALSLAQRDLALAADALSTQKTETVRLGKAAASKLFEARDSLKMARQSNVAARLSSEFDWAGVPVLTPVALAATHQTVRAVASLGVSNLFFELQHDDDFTIGALRRLSAHWQELRPIIEAENVEPKPVVAGNQLGTLSQAQAVAA